MICVYWFASLHRNSRKDPHASIVSILLSLICQLLDGSKGFDLSFFHKKRLHGVRKADISVICNVLDELVARLPKRTVLFVVLDCLSLLEDAERREDSRYLIDRLCQVARTPGKAVFKLLISNAGGPFRAGADVGKEVALTVPESTDEDGAGFSRLMWNLRVENPVKELVRRSRESSRKREATKDED